MARVLLVPGLGVRTYLRQAVASVAERGHDVTLLRPPAWSGVATDLEAYGLALADRLDREDSPVDLLVGSSVGTQAAAVTAANSDRVARLLLVSPTIDPRRRTWARATWALMRGNPRADDPPTLRQGVDWVSAGVPRLVATLASSLRTRQLEELMPAVRADVTVVHTEYDYLGSEPWAAHVAERGGGTLLTAPRASHSWPYGDTAGFTDLVDHLIV
jgi:pimeloyl-ACP methyl ester carboxylesterase